MWPTTRVEERFDLPVTLLNSLEMLIEISFNKISGTNWYIASGDAKQMAVDKVMTTLLSAFFNV